MAEIMQIPNEDYNFLKTRMLRLEEAYKQSVDSKIRLTVKDRTLYEICERFPEFMNEYGDAFDACTMSSLKEITDLYELVMRNYASEKLPVITSEKEVKKILKLKDKALKNFIRGYNDAVAHQGLTYYSQRIDDKMVFMTVENGQFVGSATDVSKHQRNGESLCYVCRRFRRGNEVLFLTNTAKTTKGDYSSIGQSICSDYESCNRVVEDRRPLVKFLRYKLEKFEDK